MIEETIGEPFPEHCQQALNKLYYSWGVGNTLTQKALFWNNFEPDTHVSHVERLSAQWVKVMEFSWLIDQFPEEFII